MDLSKVIEDDKKRPASSPASDTPKKVKRGKYTAVACDECKKRKLKCIPVEGENTCERCLAKGDAADCVFAPGPSQYTKEKEKTEKEQIKFLTEDLNLLRHQFSSLADTVKELKVALNVRSPVSNAHSRTSISKPHNTVGRRGSHGHADANSHSPISHRDSHPSVPKQPQFVGPTRSAFSFIIGEKSLTKMGIPTFEETVDTPSEAGGAPGSSPAHRGSGAVAYLGSFGKQSIHDSLSDEAVFWKRCSAQELVRLLSIFQEEVESVYPFIEIGDLQSKAAKLLEAIEETMQESNERRGEELYSRRSMYNTDGNGHAARSSPETGARWAAGKEITLKDIEMAKVAVATALVVEAQGKTELSTTMVESVERDVARFSRPEASLKDLQLMTMLSTYYFHSDDELLAWRAIGVAVREALEMGLHRKKSLFENFPDEKTRRLATRAFWCVYVLDRRWSFGTSLPFALGDRDIDPDLPEPNSEFSYLKCMVGYGRLCSKLWRAIPPFGSPSHSIPDETVRSLDLATSEWLDSIPANLQLRHPNLDLATSATQAQPRILHRLRALLYLRANHIRILIYRHHLLSISNITTNLKSSWLVVNVAKDTLQILVHLHATTEIYTRQQNVFNYFLLSALAVIFLAVCHAPSVFTCPCRKSFLDAVDLVRGFSRDSVVSRRLWESIRGLIPRLRRLGIVEDSCGEEVNSGNRTSGASSHIAAGTSEQEANTPSQGYQHHQQHQQHLRRKCDNTPVSLDPTEPTDDLGRANEAMPPDMFQMRNELLTLFDAFGQGQGQGQGMQGDIYVPPSWDGGGNAYYTPTPGNSVREEGNGWVEMGEWDFSKRFQGLM